MVNVRGGVVSAEVIDDANDYSTTLVDCAFKNCGLVSSPGGYILHGYISPCAQTKFRLVTVLL